MGLGRGQALRAVLLLTSGGRCALLCVCWGLLFLPVSVTLVPFCQAPGSPYTSCSRTTPDGDVNHFLPHSPGRLVKPSHVAVLDEGKGIVAHLLGIIAGQSAKAGHPGVSLHADDHHQLPGHSVVLQGEQIVEFQATSAGQSRKGRGDGLAAQNPVLSATTSR